MYGCQDNFQEMVLSFHWFQVTGLMQRHRAISLAQNKKINKTFQKLGMVTQTFQTTSEPEVDGQVQGQRGLLSEDLQREVQEEELEMIEYQVRKKWIAFSKNLPEVGRQLSG